jgi:paraquat-inducible protein B
VWVWIVPIAAAGVLGWLAWSTLAERGPEITISFSAAQGLQPGQATIQHLNAVVGTVTSLHLTNDMQRVIVHARMLRRVTPFLTDSTIFYVVTPHLGVGGISGLSTIVSGSYIEMYPGKDGKPRRRFVGLDNPPMVAPGSAGRYFTLREPDLSSLTEGSPVTYRGIDVGVVTAYALSGDEQQVNVTAFIRAARPAGASRNALLERRRRLHVAGSIGAATACQLLATAPRRWCGFQYTACGVGDRAQRVRQCFRAL